MTDNDEKIIVPEHVAIIMDGNGRWANKRGLNRIKGHQHAVKNVQDAIEFSLNNDISYLTLFAFSTENWLRPPEEVNFLLNLVLKSLRDNIKKFSENNIRVRFVGDLSALDDAILKEIRNAEQVTKECDSLNLTIALNYGGRWDITQACKAIVESNIPASDITEDEIYKKLALSYAPDVDLFIRTSGEQRISNFLLWSLAYSELYFTPVHWPDFGEEEFKDAVNWFASRERRFGNAVCKNNN